MKQKEQKKPDLRDKLKGREDLATEEAHSVFGPGTETSNEQSDTKPWPDNSTVPEGQTTKGGA